jgi:hypothetical protein
MMDPTLPYILQVFRGKASITMGLQRHRLVWLEQITLRRDCTLFVPCASTRHRDTTGVYYTRQPSDGFGIVGW